jgi:exoribonuclease-2
MIASNRAVARALDAAGAPAIRRVVKEPERWARLIDYAREHGHTLPQRPSSRALSAFVLEMRRAHTPDEFAEISLAVVKLMGRGEYVAHSPSQPAAECGHFGLATAEYTHATAPNRRFPDLITHRLLKSLQGAARPYAPAELEAIAARCTKMEAEAQKVERRVKKSAAAALLHGRVGDKFQGIVTGASDKGVYARVLQPLVEGKVVHGGRGLRVGDKVRLRLVDTSVEQGFIDFAVV